MSDDAFKLGQATPCKETAKAICVKLASNPKVDLWVPKSMIDEDSEVYRLDSGTGELIVKRWWAEKAGLVKSEDPESEDDVEELTTPRFR